MLTDVWTVVVYEPLQLIVKYDSSRNNERYFKKTAMSAARLDAWTEIAISYPVEKGAKEKDK